MQTPVRPPLRRPERGRVLGGVAAGLAVHLGLSVRLVRVLFVVLTPVAFFGPLLYIFWWVTVPLGDAGRIADQRPAAQSRLAPVLSPARVDLLRRLPWGETAVGGGLVVAAVALLLNRSGLAVGSSWLVPVLLLVAGVALAWSQLDAVQKERKASPRNRVSVLRLVGGLVIAGVGVLLLVGKETEPATLVQSTVAALAVLAGVALVLAPWWLRLVRELGDERTARARESERADIAAHLHDSVLQTLALIRARADDATEVARLARAQERELRAWLYDDRPEPGTSVAAVLRETVAEIEDTRVGSEGEAVTIDVVVVGDCEPDQNTDALLQATREALLNAVRHGRPPVSCYLEVGPTEVEAFVRDRGTGFDLAAVPQDRFGVRESILGRVRRRGGTASVVCKDGGGTEVRLQVPRAGVANEAPADPAEERTMQS
ncbi:ATP-binding protein [Cellulomonas denverensis]|uniref:PspC domain-containing protein n=1 Tax=Cellulomonas denverensis TaxID=264297 RepID=A0A7X6KYG8_9CELL|nr:ATP-binding protein [Cellulomonas denverensis]NKY24516.1 PspC domain-containing protein [Cellulomonas denverensis]GIG26264.1 histidine kinase [Cellulomonas denverensis]